jgi:hypothetical protein
MAIWRAKQKGAPVGSRHADRRTRSDPIRVAEEYSMIDVISRGRLEMDFVRACRSRSTGQHQPGRADRAVLGGARPDPQGDD